MRPAKLTAAPASTAATASIPRRTARTFTPRLWAASSPSERMFSFAAPASAAARPTAM